MDTIFWFKAFELIASLSILVLVHELGHFMWARIFKVKVEAFYMFFDAYGFALLRWNKEGLHICDFFHFPRFKNMSETEYGIGWIPLGGYCAIAGMVDETHTADDIKAMEGDDLFLKKSKFAQFMIMVGGVLNNLILAVLIYIGMSWHWGRDIIEPQNLPYGACYSQLAKNIGFEDGDIILSTNGKVLEDFTNAPTEILLANEVEVLRNSQSLTITMPDTLGTYLLANKDELARFVAPRMTFVIEEPTEGSPAAAAGLQKGDSAVLFFHEIKALLASHAGDSICLDYWRGDSLMQTTIGVRADSTIGVKLADNSDLFQACTTHIDYTLWQAIPEGCKRGWNMLYNYVRQFKLVFTRQGAKEVGGFGTMGKIFPEEWIWKAFWGLTAFISVALAFMNILPIPGLDGGHILILLIEALLRRPLSDKLKERLVYIGFSLLLVLMIAVNANDIYKYFFA